MKTATSSISSGGITFLLFLIQSLAPASAATVSRSGHLIVSGVTSGIGTAFQIGDVFTYTLSYNDAVTDSDSDPDYGEFSGALTGFTILPQSVRTGIWSPSGLMGAGNVYAESDAQQAWYFDVTPGFGFGPPANGYQAMMFAMGFGGLPANGDIGGGQTLGQVTGAILDFVSPSNNNYAELSFESGLDNQLVTFELTSFHAPEPGRAMLLLFGVYATIFSRKRR
ncbi:MAG: hypothetical protein K1X78_26765 [Verrucomicrobiaceae bacterium]|nr:hypothetical protein [Verrucomicrobiaceae bacterium]